MAVFSPFELIAQISKKFEENKHIFDELPGYVEKWTGFLQGIHDRTVAHTADFHAVRNSHQVIHANHSLILSLLRDMDRKLDEIKSLVSTPGDMTPELTAAAAANALHDPRNKKGVCPETGELCSSERCVELGACWAEHGGKPNG